MDTIKFVSANAVIAKIIRDFNLEGSSWHTAAIEWIGEALQDIGTGVQLEDHPLEKTIIDYKVSLPCNIELLLNIHDKDGCQIHPYEKTANTVKNYNKTYNVPVAQHKHYTINGNFLNFSFTDEKITILYKDYVKDEEGYPKVIDHVLVTTALSYYVVHKYLLRGGSHPNIKWNDALALYTKYKDQASNLLLLPRPDQMNVIMANWVSHFPNTNFSF